MTPEFEGLGLVDLIGLLEEVPEPPPVPMTPQTPGWIVVAVLAALLIALVLRRVVRTPRAEAYRRAALAALTAAGDDPAALAAILRRTALAAFPRARVAALTGAEWLEFLDQSFPGGGFAEGPGRILAAAPFRATPPDPAATALARDWILRHRRSAEVE